MDVGRPGDLMNYVGSTWLLECLYSCCT